jgi:SagB-type dehydrogenase family enzyme
MTSDLWTEMLESSGGEGAADAPVSELFHENSKLSRLDSGLPDEHVVARMQAMWDSLPYDQYPVVELPSLLPATHVSLEQAVLTRRSARSLAPAAMNLSQVATILTYAYGVTRDNDGTAFPRPFRAAPSAGALYPLELYFHALAVDGLEPGLYHYNPAHSNLRRLRAGDLSYELGSAMAQPMLAYGSSMLVLITALFPRLTFKYGERGYRFALLEAGHVAQNINLAANAYGFASVNLGGFYDREIDALLGLDGVRHSTLYLVAIGHEFEDVVGVGDGP